MPRETRPRVFAREWIERLPNGTTFSNTQLYRYLETHFPQECSERGDAAHEPRYRNDARWAIQQLKAEGAVVDTARVGEHRWLGHKHSL
jgi:hypothetical protein